MIINCKAENYCIVKENGYYYVYDTRFEQSLFKVLISAVFESFLPDVNTYKNPLAIKIRAIDNVDVAVCISKDLKVEGTEEFEYFIPNEHYSKWKKTYFICSLFLLIINILIFVLMGYIFWKSKFNIIAGLAVGIILIMLVVNAVKIKKKFNLSKRYPVRDLKS